MPKRNKITRPSQQDFQRIVVKLTTEQYNLLSIYALSTGLKLSTAVRQIVNNFLRTEKPKDLFDNLFSRKEE